MTTTADILLKRIKKHIDEKNEEILDRLDELEETLNDLLYGDEDNDETEETDNGAERLGDVEALDTPIKEE